MSTREHVLAALRDADGGGVSGESLAHLLGVSRAAVAKHVAALRETGYRIEGSPGTGYRLTFSPPLALPWEVRHLVRNPLWREFTGGLQTGSTNDDARELARAGAPEGTVVVASRQAGGRGRMGRTWESPPGGAYVSFVLRPPVAPVEAGSLALAVALGIARGLERLGVSAGLKWPNDVYLGDSKLAGILLEMSAETDRVTWVVAGFGINVLPPHVRQTGAAYVADVAGPEASPSAVAAAALNGIAEILAVWLDGRFSALREAYEARSVLTGQTVTVSDAMGAVRVRGIVEGVDDEGRLLVRGEAGIEAVASGEVTLRG